MPELSCLKVADMNTKIESQKLEMIKYLAGRWIVLGSLDINLNPLLQTPREQNSSSEQRASSHMQLVLGANKLICLRRLISCYKQFIFKHGSLQGGVGDPSPSLPFTGGIATIITLMLSVVMGIWRLSR